MKFLTNEGYARAQKYKIENFANICQKIIIARENIEEIKIELRKIYEKKPWYLSYMQNANQKKIK